MSEEDNSSIDDDDDNTELVTLVGEGDRYRKLVEDLFQTDWGNWTIRDAQNYSTLNDFVEELGAGYAGNKKGLLRSWAVYYRDKLGFGKQLFKKKEEEKEEEQQEDDNTKAGVSDDTTNPTTTTTTTENNDRAARVSKRTRNNNSSARISSTQQQQEAVDRIVRETSKKSSESSSSSRKRTSNNIGGSPTRQQQQTGTTSTGRKKQKLRTNKASLNESTVITLLQAVESDEIGKGREAVKAARCGIPTVLNTLAEQGKQDMVGAVHRYNITKIL